MMVMKMMSVLLALAVALCLLPPPATSLSPKEFAQKVADRIVKDQSIFLTWAYGGAIIVDAMYDLNPTFGLDYTPLLDTYLTRFKTDPKSNPYGYKLLHDAHLPYDKAPGDGVGLFPINYLSRALRNPRGNETESDFFIVRKVAMDYILTWPYRIPDGTYSRVEGWKGEQGNETYVWNDDQFMGFTLLARMAAVDKNSDLLRFVVKEAIQFDAHFVDQEDGLHFHGYNAQDGKRSCCKWGRGNGWGMISHIEILEALATINNPENVDLEKAMAGILARHTQGVLSVQSDEGRWHQVLTANETFLETSATAMFLSSLARGVLGGWIPRGETVDRAIRTGWEGIQKALQPDGTVSGICTGTGIETSVAEYDSRPTLYVLSAPGLGSVLYAARDVERYMQAYGEA